MSPTAPTRSRQRSPLCTWFVGAAVGVAAATWLVGTAVGQTAGSARAGTAKSSDRATDKAADKSAAATKSTTSVYAERFASTCAACHGANGRSEIPGTPSLAGQPAFFAMTQLYLFREGRRPNEAMTAMAKPMKDDDLRGFADFIGTLAPVAAPSAGGAPDPARMRAGQQLAQQHRCSICHGANLEGQPQVPRLAGQREEYLKSALSGFRAGTRVGYTPQMAESVRMVSQEDLDAVAYYAARLP